MLESESQLKKRALRELKESLDKVPTVPLTTYKSEGIKAYQEYIEKLNKTKKELTVISLSNYIAELTNIPIIHKAHILFDDRPEEVSIRIEYIDNMHKLDQTITEDAENELNILTDMYRIENCKRIELSFIMKEVIE